ncbi:hypothetical protein [Jiangella mangrovi]|uniref:AsnC family protein n=1 Tax=Jiangella mangrovi TaxID=1524084 RepID=A0A7W9GPB3_9ACTN|nr:hypothetical protein [Jiangella mangrovi]MBB5787530.1 hypothetical protein [Jiangella mangrovi]
MAKTRHRNSVDEWLDSLDPKSTPARDGKNLRAIGRALDHVEESQSELVRAIADARAEGDSWAAIAAVLGTSKQAAHRKFAPMINERSRR